MPGTTQGFYGEDGSLQTAKVQALARTYPQAICGIPSRMSFNHTNGHFLLVYTISECRGPTEIYVNREWWYPNGFDATAYPRSVGKFELVKPYLLHFVHHANVKAGQLVQIEIKRK